VADVGVVGSGVPSSARDNDGLAFTGVVSASNAKGIDLPLALGAPRNSA
jgi:hypothetical protein